MGAPATPDDATRARRVRGRAVERDARARDDEDDDDDAKAGIAARREDHAHARDARGR
jgi:hypothetical protein